MTEILHKPDLIRRPQQAGDPTRLVGSRCGLCGQSYFPPKKVCLSCLKEGDMAEILLGPRAKLDSFAVMQIGTDEFPAPYIMAYVIFVEGVRIFTLIAGCEPKEDALHIGQEMELVIDHIKTNSDGDQLMGWKFQPLGGACA